ncbi:MAG: ABC transporter ATP-binding protein/permease [Candidatus Omnitrophica bacterium]|nr:ABC transporter ATP-binding protein/permease [Candidatus Omnitrophota bacterium]MBU1996310.1 ABC transporter ATP-binding protein/permease [Candidatus Omnitrophota bacterium]MBU4332811.1 ABC transporter ATP-binding protein/permease [Candidatus Omnitrophota bacterium]
MNNYFKLLSFLKDHRRLFSTAVFTMFVASLFEGFQLSLLVPMTDRIFNNKKIATPGNLPEFISNFIDKLNTIEPQTMFWIFPVVVIIAMVIKHVFVFAHQYLMGDVSQRVIRDVRSSLYEKIQNLSLDYFSQKRTGELISRITNDVNMIENAVSYGLTDLCKSVFLIFIYVVIAFMIYPKAAIVLFVVFPLIGIPINQIGKKLRKLSKSHQEKMADINSLLLETISGVRVVKAFGNEDYETKRFKSENHGFYKIKMKSIKRTIVIAPLTELFGAVCGVAIIFLIGRSVMEGDLSFGVFILFFGSIMSIISPIKKLGNVNALIQQALAANQRIYAVLDEEPSVKEKENFIELNELSDSIVMENIDFYYGNESEIVLKGVNLEIKKGEIVAIVGPTGTGKTTLVNLMPRFYDPIKGVVKMDGVDIKEASFHSLRKQFGIVTQESILFNDTVRANIAYGYHEASQEEIESAARKAFAHTFIEKMPEGYDTIVGDRGFRLSGGEKQRICIARAILANPPILILDEATSQLDSESEKFVQEALDKLMQGRTVVAIAHRLATVIKADKIVVLNEGSIEGIGKHDMLLKSCPLYKKLHEMQFKI